MVGGVGGFASSATAWVGDRVARGDLAGGGEAAGAAAPWTVSAAAAEVEADADAGAGEV